MKKLQLLLVSVAMLSIFSCSDDDDDTLGVWYRRSDFDGRARAVSYTHLTLPTNSRV